MKSERIDPGSAWKGVSHETETSHNGSDHRQTDVELGKGMKVPEVCKILEINPQTYYRWRQKYGGMEPSMAKELKALQKESARLKKMVAEQALDMEILRESAKGNW